MHTDRPTWSRKANRRRRRARRWPATAVSVVFHAGVLAALVFTREPPPQVPEPEPIQIALVEIPPDPPPPAEAPGEPAEAAPAKPTPPKPPPKRIPPRPPPPPNIKPLLVAKAEVAPAPSLTDAQLAGAASAGAGSGAGGGSGSGGGACNMLRRLQTALRKDRMVQAAVSQAQSSGGSFGKSVLVWNGDWVRNGGEEGRGLAAVRQAIIWEVGFAPEACRREAVRGLVQISLNDGPGSSRVIVGAGQWRWSDLLNVRTGR
jgi:hypothetical protein